MTTNTTPSKTFYAGFFPCGCLVMAVDTHRSDSVSLASFWRDLDYDVRELSALEIGAIRCATPHTTQDMEAMGRIQAEERRRVLMGVQS